MSHSLEPFGYHSVRLKKVGRQVGIISQRSVGSIAEWVFREPEHTESPTWVPFHCVAMV